MGLQKFNRTGLLTRETTYLLKNLATEIDWEQAKDKLYVSGFIPSENRNYELYREIKRRFTQQHAFLPGLEAVSMIARSKINQVSKAEIYLVYLYHSDVIFATILNQVFEIRDQDKKDPIITRGTIKSLIKIYLKKNETNQDEKTIQNWIGKFISTLKETRILVPKKRNVYILNASGLSAETWTFFLMDAHFNGYSYGNALFKEVFHVLPEEVPAIIERCNAFNWISYEIKNGNTNGNVFNYEPEYHSIAEWLSKFEK
ncbi:MAG: hypothetical protein ACFFD4_23065 [Candidatus Odinarchaeota archaeon]